eukprot:2216957-Prymnesium_polylepis.1
MRAGHVGRAGPPRGSACCMPWGHGESHVGRGGIHDPPDFYVISSKILTPPENGDVHVSFDLSGAELIEAIIYAVRHGSRKSHFFRQPSRGKGGSTAVIKPRKE